MGTLLRYPYEVRDEKEYFDEVQDVKVTKDRRCFNRLTCMLYGATTRMSPSVKAVVDVALL
jgi:non-homologous end joining protein Ku